MSVEYSCTFSARCRRPRAIISANILIEVKGVFNSCETLDKKFAFIAKSLRS